MADDLRELLDSFLAKPFPDLGKQIGDFPLYDTMIAGIAMRVCRGELVRGSDVPAPDEVTVERVAELRRKSERTGNEQTFLDYFDLLERIRMTLHRAGPA